MSSTPLSTATTSASPSATTDSLSASCTTAVPGQYGNVPIDACNSYYNFDPSFAPAVAVAVLFALLTTAHVVEAFAFKKRYAWVVIMGGLWETIAFILHALGSHDQQNIGYATGYNILFLLAPLWINAFVYMTLARMVYYFLPTHRVGPFCATSMSKYFVWADVVTFIVQGVGGIMASPGADPNTINIGLKVYLVGLGFQEFFIVCFLGLMVAFHRSCLGLDASAMGSGAGVEGFGAPAVQKRGWKGLLFALYAVLAFISMRILPHCRVWWWHHTIEPDSLPRGVCLRSGFLPHDGVFAHPGCHAPRPDAAGPGAGIPQEEPPGEEGREAGQEGGEGGAQGGKKGKGQGPRRADPDAARVLGERQRLRLAHGGPVMATTMVGERASGGVEMQDYIGSEHNT